MNEAVKATNIDGAEPIIDIENLSISFFTKKGEIPAVMDFSCSVLPGEAMGIVGESGCGKSTVSLGIMRDLSNVGKIVGGQGAVVLDPGHMRHPVDEDQGADGRADDNAFGQVTEDGEQEGCAENDGIAR